MARLRTCAAALLTLALVAVHPPMAEADDPPVQTSRTALLDDNRGEVMGVQRGGSRRTATRTASNPTRILTRYQPVCAYTGAPSADVCHRSSTLCISPDSVKKLTAVWVLQAPSSPPPGADDWVNTGRVECLAAREATPAVVVTAEQFRRLPIPGPEIITQPPDRVTLINIGTNFLTRKEAVILPTTVLGQAVRVRATPASYAWQYGDGGWLTTADPDGLYPNMPTAHVFTVPGTYQVDLTTTFTGEFSVGGGPWQPINGTAAAPSRPTTITAQERRAVLIK